MKNQRHPPGRPKGSTGINHSKYNDAPAAAVVDKDNLLLKFFDEIILDRALRLLEKDITFFKEQG